MTRERETLAWFAEKERGGKEAVQSRGRHGAAAPCPLLLLQELRELGASRDGTPCCPSLGTGRARSRGVRALSDSGIIVVVIIDNNINNFAFLHL